MTTRSGRRAASLLSILAVLAVAASCTTAAPAYPPQPTADVTIDSNSLFLVDDNNDCFGVCVADEPYLVNLAFRVQFNNPGSASTFVVHNVSNELTCPGSPPGFPFPSSSCATGETASIPNAMGRVSFADVKLVDVLDLALGRQPEVAGAFIFAYEEDQIFGSGNVADTVASFASAVRTVLNATVAAGSLPADENAAADLLVDVIGDVALSFIGNTILGLLSGLGNADDFIGVAPVIVAGVSGTLAGLVNAAGLSNQAVLNGKVLTAGPPQDITLNLLGQNVGGITLGSTDTHYRVTTNVGAI